MLTLLYYKAKAIPSKKGLQNMCCGHGLSYYLGVATVSSEELLSKGNEVCSCKWAGQQFRC